MSKESLYPHVPKRKEPLYPHQPREKSSTENPGKQFINPKLLIPRDPPVKLTLEERKWWDWALEGLEDALADEWFVKDNPTINTLKGQLDDLHYRLTKQSYDVAETDATSAELAARVRVLNSLNRKLNSVRFFEQTLPRGEMPTSTEKSSNPSKQFIKVGERVRYIDPKSKYRYETWPPDAWLEYSVTGTVIEYHPESPEVRIKGEIFEALPPYAVVRWDLGGEANTAIDPDDEGERWERIETS